MIRISPRFGLPVMIFVGVLVVGLRVGDIWNAVANGQVFAPVQTVQAAADSAAASKEAPAAEASAAKPAATEAKPDDTSRPAPTESSSSSPESDLYKQLMGRREELDKRAHELDDREAFVAVAEKRVDQKIKEMDVMRKQLETLLGQASAAQQAQLENLVKVYEIMKPKEAAKIFESLDMPILLGVVQKMKAARTAAVLAEMNPEKAKEITTALTKQDQLPQIK